MYDRILLPTDGGRTTDRALEHVSTLATQYGSTVHVLYVIDGSMATSDIETGQIVEQFETIGEETVEEIITQIEAAGIDDIVSAVRRGNPTDQILEYAGNNEIDLIVMGTRGLTGIDRYLVGSVTEKVVRQSDVPVLSVRLPDDERDERSV